MNSLNYKLKASDWAYAGGQPTITGRLRSTLEDFIVIEYLSFELSGQGEHIYLNVEKRGLNSIDVVQKLAMYCGVDANRIGYAGLKDKHAQTTQWFSIYISGFPEPDWTTFDDPQIIIQQLSRHNKKLKRGAIKLNHFSIVLRSVQGDIKAAERRLQAIQRQGVPNYFGEQRFGFAYQNLDMVQAMVSGKKKVKNRHRRGMYYSAARSFLFNELLSLRVAQSNWNCAIEGDVMSLDGSRSFFKPEQLTAEINQRLLDNDIHPSGPLVGAGDSKAAQLALQFEQQSVQEYEPWRDWLVSERVDMSRRALRLIPKALQWQWINDDQLKLDFDLPSGSYATTVLREIISYS